MPHLPSPGVVGAAHGEERPLRTACHSQGTDTAQTPRLPPWAGDPWPQAGLAHPQEWEPGRASFPRSTQADGGPSVPGACADCSPVHAEARVCTPAELGTRVGALCACSPPALPSSGSPTTAAPRAAERGQGEAGVPPPASACQ